MSSPENENKDSQFNQGFVLPKKKKKQISSSVLAGLVLLIIMVGSLYWFQQQAQLKSEMDELIETSKTLGDNSSDLEQQKPAQASTEEQKLVVLEDVKVEEENKQTNPQPAQNVQNQASSQVANQPIEAPTAQTELESVEEGSQEEVNVSLSASQPLFENILVEEVEEPQEKKKIVVEFDVDETSTAQTKEPELKEVSSNVMAFESLNAVKNANAVDVQFGLKNLNQSQHRGIISFALIQADGSRNEVPQPQGTYSFRMRVDKKYTLPITADNKENFDKAFALVVEIKDRAGKVIISKPYKF